MARPEAKGLLIGLTYDLRDDYAGALAAEWGLEEEHLAEFDSVATIDALEGALRENGYRTERIGNVRALVGRLAEGARWDLVFNIAEGLFGYGREAQVPALLDAYRIPYTFSDPLASCVTLHKATAKHVLAGAGIPTPPFLLAHAVGDAAPARLAEAGLAWPLFAKPVAEGTSKGVDAASILRTQNELESVVGRLLTRFSQGVLIEEYLPGRECTVGLLGTGARARAVGAVEIALLPGADADVYSFRNKEECETLVDYRRIDDAFAREASDLAVRAWRALDCRDGGRVDVRQGRDGRCQVIELNPLPGMHPSHSDLPILWSQGGGTYPALVGAIVTSALERAHAGQPR